MAVCLSSPVAVCVVPYWLWSVTASCSWFASGLWSAAGPISCLFFTSPRAKEERHERHVLGFRRFSACTGRLFTKVYSYERAICVSQRLSSCLRATRCKVTLSSASNAGSKRNSGQHWVKHGRNIYCTGFQIKYKCRFLKTRENMRSLDRTDNQHAPSNFIAGTKHGKINTCESCFGLPKKSRRKQRYHKLHHSK